MYNESIELTNEAKLLYKPVAALVVYKNDNDDFMAESHKILASGSFGAAKPVSIKFMSKVAESFATHKLSTQMHGRVPSNSLYIDTRNADTILCWWNPPQRRQQCFSPQVGLKDGEYNMPGIVYCVKNDSLSVYAFPGKRPSANTRLLYGPYFNYYDNNSMCLGNSKLEKPVDYTWENIQKYWEKMFWDSVNAHTICNPMNGKHNLCIELKKAMDKPFDWKTLRKTEYTLDKLLTKIANEKY